MFEPKYKLSPKILSNIAQTERLYGRLESVNIPQKLELNLQREHLIKASYISNSIEGNPLSLPEVSNLLLGDRVPANRDEKEVRNYFELLKSLDQDKGKPLDIPLILSLHQRLMTGVKNEIAGHLRDGGGLLWDKEN